MLTQQLIIGFMTYNYIYSSSISSQKPTGKYLSRRLFNKIVTVLTPSTSLLPLLTRGNKVSTSSNKINFSAY